MKTSVSIIEFNQAISSNKNTMIVDVRSEKEYLEKHIPSAINIPIETIESGNFTPPLNKIIITVCAKGGGRSERASNYLKNRFSNVICFLDGGTLGWFENEQHNK